MCNMLVGAVVCLPLLKQAGRGSRFASAQNHIQVCALCLTEGQAASNLPAPESMIVGCWRTMTSCTLGPPALSSRIQANVDMDPSTSDAKVLTNPFGLLPDQVLRQILKDGCDERTQQAAYRACKEIRDFCNRNMKSVTVEIYPANDLKVLKEKSSRTMCPQAAYGIESLTVCVTDGWSVRENWVDAGPRNINNTDYEPSYAHLEQLLSDAFMSADNSLQCRKKQLSNVTNLKLKLPKDFSTTDQHCLIVSRLLSYLPNLQKLHLNVGRLLSCVSAQHLQQLTCEELTPEQLHEFAKHQPGIQTLEFVMASGVHLDMYMPALLHFNGLQKLSVTGARCAPMDDMSAVSGRSLAKLTQLRRLKLLDVEISEAHSLTQLHITHLTMGNVSLYRDIFRDLSRDEQQQQPAEPPQWPALECFELVTSPSGGRAADINEATARAVLPLPHPGFKVVWPKSVHYKANTEPHPQFGYICVAHMASVHEVRLGGSHFKSALRAMVSKQVSIHTLDLFDRYGGLFDVRSDEVAACLALPTVVKMQAQTLKTDSPEFFRQLFLHCPLLKGVHVSLYCLPKHLEVPEYLKVLRQDHTYQFVPYIGRPENGIY